MLRVAKVACGSFEYRRRGFATKQLTRDQQDELQVVVTR